MPFPTLLILWLAGSGRTLEGSCGASHQHLHCPTPGEDVCKVGRIALGSTVCLSKRTRSERRTFLPPCLRPSWTPPKEACEDSLPRIACARAAQKQHRIFSRHQMGCAPAARASLARLLVESMPVERVLPHLCNRHEQPLKRCGVYTGEGTQHPRGRFESVIGEHRYRFFSRVRDFDSVVYLP